MSYRFDDPKCYRTLSINGTQLEIKCSLIGLYSDYSGACVCLFYPGQDDNYYIQDFWLKTGQVSLTSLTDRIEQWALKYQVDKLQANPTQTLNNYIQKRGLEKIKLPGAEYSQAFKSTACMRVPVDVEIEPDEGYQVINSLLAEDRLICSPSCADLLETHLTNYVHGEVDHLIYSLFHGIAYYEQQTHAIQNTFLIGQVAW